MRVLEANELLHQIEINCYPDEYGKKQIDFSTLKQMIEKDLSCAGSIETLQKVATELLNCWANDEKEIIKWMYQDESEKAKQLKALDVIIQNYKDIIGNKGLIHHELRRKSH